jgi:hypothetical protein
MSRQQSRDKDTRIIANEKRSTFALSGSQTQSTSALPHMMPPSNIVQALNSGSLNRESREILLRQLMT